jgi:hypothetical protein
LVAYFDFLADEFLAQELTRLKRVRLVVFAAFGVADARRTDGRERHFGFDFFGVGQNQRVARVDLHHTVLGAGGVGRRQRLRGSGLLGVEVLEQTHARLLSVT